MSEYTVSLSLQSQYSRVLLTQQNEELMRAILPPPRQVQHERAAITFLQGLAMWLDRSPHVVVSAADAEATFFFGLTDEMGIPQKSVYYDVMVAQPPVRRRPKRIAGIGDFRDLRQLTLIDGGRR